MIKFGPSGNSDSFYRDGRKNTFEAPQWLSEKGLNAYEYSFGRGINVSDETARKIGEKCKEFGVELSVHAPYYVNLANPDDEMAKKSFGYIVNSAKKLMQFGGNRVVFHPASVGKATREQAVKLTMQRMYALRDEIYKNNLQHLTFCPEVMGKINQIGDLEEVLNFCTIDPCFVPTIDFGHLNARTHGLLKTQKDFEQAIEKSIEIIGFEKTAKIHIHFSKIEYSNGGEVKHLTFHDQAYGPNFENLAPVLVKYKLEPVVICESDGTQAEDALYMKTIYQNLLEKTND